LGFKNNEVSEVGSASVFTIKNTGRKACGQLQDTLRGITKYRWKKKKKKKKKKDRQ